MCWINTPALAHAASTGTCDSMPGSCVVCREHTRLKLQMHCGAGGRLCLLTRLGCWYDMHATARALEASRSMSQSTYSGPQPMANGDRLQILRPRTRLGEFNGMDPMTHEAQGSSFPRVSRQAASSLGRSLRSEETGGRRKDHHACSEQAVRGR